MRSVDSRSWPIVAGYLPVAFAFGVTGVSWHLPAWLILGLSLLVYAGASQFAVVPLLSAAANPLVAVATGWLINLRMVIESVAFVGRARWAERQPAALFWLTDEVFVTASLTSAPESSRDFLKLALPPYAAWVLGTAAGVWLGSLLGAAVSEALSLSLYGLYLALVVFAVQQDRTTLAAAAFGAMGSAAAHGLGLGPWSLVVGSLVGGAAYAWFDRTRMEPGDA